jgi:hypothetical protein
MARCLRLSGDRHLVVIDLAERSATSRLGNKWFYYITLKVIISNSIVMNVARHKQLPLTYRKRFFRYIGKSVMDGYADENKSPKRKQTR